RLHHATLPRVLQSLPPLLTMETLLFRMIGIGFALLTLTLASGVVFSEEIFGKAWQFNHKVLFGFVSWGVFAVLLWGHYSYGWRGRTAVRWTVSGFVFLLLAYLGSKFVLEVLLHR
ncbi:MAG: cytochrome c biogenesis protein CcsA, partial [Gallionella sp.]|nr:cytochrome c biogenesis protein CcsA [Gallionella sp.]